MEGKTQQAAAAASATSEVPRLLLDEDPDLVLLDLVLPGSDGIELMGKYLRLGTCLSYSCLCMGGMRWSPRLSTWEPPTTW